MTNADPRLKFSPTSRPPGWPVDEEWYAVSESRQETLQGDSVLGRDIFLGNTALGPGSRLTLRPATYGTWIAGDELDSANPLSFRYRRGASVVFNSFGPQHSTNNFPSQSYYYNVGCGVFVPEGVMRVGARLYFEARGVFNNSTAAMQLVSIVIDPNGDVYALPAPSTTPAGNEIEMLFGAPNAGLPDVDGTEGDVHLLISLDNAYDPAAEELVQRWSARMTYESADIQVDTRALTPPPSYSRRFNAEAIITSQRDASSSGGPGDMTPWNYFDKNTEIAIRFGVGGPQDGTSRIEFNFCQAWVEF